MPFVSVRIEDDKNDSSMRIRPCCLYDTQDPVKFNTVDEYLKSDLLQELQTHLLTQDELPAACKNCAAVESQNQLSVRQLKNKYFSIDPPSKTNIIELDLFPSNVCNLSCIMCGPKFSSAIGAEQKRMGMIKQVYNFDETDLICDAIETMQGLEYVSIAGGEFFYAKHCTRILKLITQSGIKNFKLTTNGTICKTAHLELLQSISNLTIRFSCDGVGDTYNFVRHPSRWDQVQANILKFKQALPHAHFEIVMVMQPFTVFSLFDWLKFAQQHTLETHWINIQGPRFTWKMLTQQERNIASEFIMSNLDAAKLDSKQKLALLNYARNTISQEVYDSDHCDQSIDYLINVYKLRKLTQQQLDNVIGPWQYLKQKVNMKLSNETCNHSN
jgi:molybdenum cofactor biosynthesis enzyme MoaA